MLKYLVRRLLTMIPTLLVISMLVFVIIQLPPGDYLESHIAELQAQGESVDEQKIEFLRKQYGLDKPVVEQYLVWLFGMLQGDFGYSFEYDLPVTEVVGDRLFLTVLISIATILFTWMIAFPIGIYSATHQYSWGDYGLSTLGFLGLATPNFLLALVMLYFANVYFGTSIGGLMAPEYIDAPWSLDKLLSILEHLWIPVIVIGTCGHRGHDSAPARQPARRVAKTVRGHRPCQRIAAGQVAAQVPAAGSRSIFLSPTLATCYPR